MAKLNPRRRKARAIRDAIMAERNAQHPAVRSPKGLAVSPTHVDSLKGASHTQGFTGLGRSVGRETVILSRQGNLSASKVDMSATAMFGKVMPPKAPRYTAPKSQRFREEDYVTGEEPRKPVIVERKVARKGERFKRSTTVTVNEPAYHPGKVKRSEPVERADVYAWRKPIAYGFEWY